MKYPEYLDIRPYMSQPNGEPIIYVLYAVLVHTGFNCHAGHYFCYIKVSCWVINMSAVGQFWIYGGQEWNFYSEV